MSYYTDDRVTLYHGDCRDIMEGQLPDNSVDSIVTDPPYELGFMGKGWDDSGIAYNVEVWENAYRILKPGGHLLAFGGTRTWHRLAAAIEDAGFEVRDSIAWMYGSGFPKSHDVSKAIDKNNGEVGRLHKFTAWMRSVGITAAAINAVTDTNMGGHYLTAASQPAIPTPELWKKVRPVCEMLTDVPAWVDELVERIAAEREVIGSKPSSLGGSVAAGERNAEFIAKHKNLMVDITAPATPAAQQWQGWGTALKPAHEPIVVARKPLIGTVAANVLTHGTGALNIDGCRINPGQGVPGGGGLKGGAATRHKGWQRLAHIESEPTQPHTAGRWPANVILDESQAAALDAQSGVSTGGKRVEGKVTGTTFGSGATMPDDLTGVLSYGDTGGASRFFYCPKAGKKERPNVNGVAHPTVKPMALMQYLVRLVTPPGGTVLEPFAGSGTTIEAALNEGFNVIGIEMTDEYLPLIMARIERYGDKLC